MKIQSWKLTLTPLITNAVPRASQDHLSYTPVAERGCYGAHKACRARGRTCRIPLQGYRRTVFRRGHRVRGGSAVRFLYRQSGGATCDCSRELSSRHQRALNRCKSGVVTGYASAGRLIPISPGTGRHRTETQVPGPGWEKTQSEKLPGCRMVQFRKIGAPPQKHIPAYSFIAAVG